MKLLIFYNHLLAHPLALIGIGLFIRFIINRRRFNRRGVAGLQLFSSYEKWWLTTRIEALFYFLGLLAVVAGILLFILK
jgi:hypothetical protein